MHLLYATPVQRGNLEGKAIQPIQDLVEVNNIPVTLRTEGQVSSVRLVPEGIDVAFEQKNGCLAFIVESLLGHQMVEVAYG